MSNDNTCFTDKVVIYDPLYECVVFGKERLNEQRQIFYKQYGIDKVLNQSILKIINTFEFQRLRELKQAGLSYLIHPSSTHTRYAHSIGSYYLGCLAIKSIGIGYKHDSLQKIISDRGELLRISKNEEDADQNEVKYFDSEISLEQWLEAKGLKEEFLISLLLHDIGHFPFSHSLEDNEFINEFKILPHEEIACDFIIGKGNYSALFRDYIRDFKYKDIDIDENCRFLSDAIDNRAEKNSICYLISGKEEFLKKAIISLNKKFNSSNLSFINDDGYKPSLKDHLSEIREADLMLLHKLISSIIDLDKIDHYLRDSYFIGVKNDFNIKVLLESINLFDTLDIIKIDDIGITQVLNLIWTSISFKRDIFKNPHLISLNAMLNKAVSLFIESIDGEDKQKSELAKMISFTDNGLMNYLFNNGTKQVRTLIYRLQNSIPFNLLTNFPIDVKIFDSKEELVKNVNRKLTIFFEQNPHLKDELILIYSTSKKFKNFADEPNNWLSFDILYNNKNEKLSSKSEYTQTLNFFNEGRKQNKLWFFTDKKFKFYNEEIKAKILDLKKILEEM
jgi:HD superfamily phosphohydrolase